MPSSPPSGATVIPSVEIVERPILYPIVQCEICAGTDAINVDIAKQILGWQTEDEYALFMTAENPGIKDSDPYIMPGGSITTFGKAKEFGDIFMLKDEEGNKIRCHNNLDNRPFDEGWSRGLAQSILNFQWAGPLTISEPVKGTYNPDPNAAPVTIDGIEYGPGDEITLPAGTVNGSTIVISRTAKVESGQHSLVGLVLAWQAWWKDRKKYPAWADSTGGPVLETIIITGISEDRRVLMTVDNCKPRSEADVFYTSPLFQSLTPGDRKECSRMLAAAVDLLWKRTKRQGYRTHAEVCGFVEGHMKLLKCIEHLFVENASKGGRKISSLRLSAGQCAALCYLMGCSGPKTDSDEYRNGTPPKEKGKHLDWSLFDRAKEFFGMLGAAPELQPVRVMLKSLVDSGVPDESGIEVQGLGGRANEKLAVLAKAWAVFKEGHEIEGADLKLEYHEDEETGELKLMTMADFGGIDVPDKAPSIDPPAPSEDELEKRKEEECKKRVEEAAAKIAAIRAGKSGGKPATLLVPTSANK